MSQNAIPYFFMRGGTSRGPYFNRNDLPNDIDDLAEVLIKVLGAGHPLNIDGIGGGNAVTTKVAMLSKSTLADCDIDYFFAQVSVEEKLVDFKPTCGNILSAVGAAAIEMGLSKPQEGETSIMIHAVNTGAKIKAVIQTTTDGVIYNGNCAIDGVPGTAAPISLHFMDIVGSKTGAMFPTGQAINVIDDIEVTCIDVTMPMVIGRAVDFGITGYESADTLNNNKDLFALIEYIRRKAGALMGLGDVASSVTPKFALLAPPKEAGNSIAARYFMPWKAHPTMAVTGGQCIASCVAAPNTIAQGLAGHITAAPSTIILEHPTGTMPVILDWQQCAQFDVISAGVERTCRKLAAGHVYY